MKKSYLTILLYALMSVLLMGCKKNLQTNEEIVKIDNKPTINESYKLYVNTQYGFDFSLPDSWKDYKIVSGKWEGLAIVGQKGEVMVETGPLISIRHPQWTTQSPRQDIPIMVFTINQWNSLQQEKFHIGAAPIGPSDLGRSSSYVFALPARYNYSFLEGYEEVENILKGNPLKATKND
jgi:hypothetical protein